MKHVRLLEHDLVLVCPLIRLWHKYRHVFDRSLYVVSVKVEQTQRLLQIVRILVDGLFQILFDFLIGRTMVQVVLTRWYERGRLPHAYFFFFQVESRVGRLQQELVHVRLVVVAYSAR